MALQCMVCGAVSDVEIVTHINDEHKGGLGTYVLFFPDVPVVCPEIKQAAIDWANDLPVKPVDGFDRIPDDDRRCIADTVKRIGFPRSEIVETADF